MTMQADEFRTQGHAIVDWIADYLESAPKHPVLAQVQPGQVRKALDKQPPETGEDWSDIWHDFQTHIMPGITHWQSPSFFAYFPSGNSYPSILGELLSAGLGVQGMLWSTSPAATELESLVLDWLVQLLDLPAHFRGGGVIQDTASSAALCALLAAREQATSSRSNTAGLPSLGKPVIAYTSTQAHSSIEKAVMVAGLGRSNLRLIKADPVTGAMNPEALLQSIRDDLADGATPAFVSATMGTTSTLAFDPIGAIGSICDEHGIWLHVDAAMAGTALLCPEFRHFAAGLQYADSFNFNPHKWMLTNFDCSCLYVRDPQRLTGALSVMPEYLKADQPPEMINYRDWHVQLGRRFRALKLWFVLRSFGAQALREHVRKHVELAKWFAAQIEQDDRFELAARPSLNLVCFRLAGSTDAANRALLKLLNDSGRLHLTHTTVNDQFTIRFCIGQHRTEHSHVAAAWEEIGRAADLVG